MGSADEWRRDVEKSNVIVDAERETEGDDNVTPLISAKFVKGCPSLLVPINSDWAPTDRDKNAPPVLPSRTFIGMMRTAFSRTPGKPLRPIPASFKRDVPPASGNGPTYSEFPAFYVPGRHKRQIANGFQPRYPADIMVDHDVSAVDWDRFLVNIRVAGALRGHDHLIANLIPAPLFLVHAAHGNYWITRAIMSGLQRRYIPEVLALVETYQYRFFQPRRLDVFVACGTSRLTGYFPGDDSYLSAPPVELGLRVDDSDSSDSSDSSGSSDSSDSEEDEYLRRVPRKERKSVKAAKQVPSKKELAKMNPSDRAEMEERVRNMKSDRKKVVAQRRDELEEEKRAGVALKKHGKYRIIVQPMMGEPVQPTQEWITRMVEREKKWGYNREAEQASTSGTRQ